MQCSHCGRTGKALVMETRRDESGVYRRRGCGFCGKTFVTVETAPPGLKMPSQFGREKREKRKEAACLARPGGHGYAGVRVSSDALFRAW